MNKPIYLLIIIFSVFFLDVSGQPTYSSLDITKPKKYENRTLGAEKTDTKKFKTPRHFLQNTITHYNYYYNANNKLNETLRRAKAQHKDNYDKLLSFYNYDLQTTAKDKRELDSIIYKSTSGILNHDLRNDWIDNLYMLMGKAFYFRNTLDSAYITFQYVNYVFAPKEEGGYDKPIGSNANLDEGGSALTISTQERKNVLKKVFSLPPSRNEAFIWQVKTFIARGQMGKASSLIQIIKHDPFFPARLQTDLDEVQAWWFYHENVYDSAAAYLQKALPNAVDREEQARWEYLIAQLYERNNEPLKAQEFYAKVIQHTYDPVLEVYARLYFIRQIKGTDEKLIAQNIAALVSMAKKDRYADYRDIIYYTAAQIELDQHNKTAAVGFLLQSVKYATPNSELRNKAFIQLGDIFYNDKKYKSAKSYYDSVNISDPSSIDSFNVFTDRKKALEKIVKQINIIERQDSLQRIAAMSAADRDAYIKKLVKALRKNQGLKDEDNGFVTGSYINNNAPPSLFNNANGDQGDWYFYNSSLKTRGYNDFKLKWGNRPNSDNWRVSSLIARAQRRVTAERDAGPDNAQNVNAEPAEITSKSLTDKLPLTPEKLKASNDSVENALFELGKAYMEELPDYYFAIDTYDSLLSRYANTHYREDALFNLYYCYKKIGDEINANRILKMLKDEFPSGRLTLLITNPDAVLHPDAITKSQATKSYEEIYTAFIEGRFDEALAKKQVADNVYGEKYWTPQLLFIEAVYFMHDRQDSAAKSMLALMIKKYTGTAMAEKAKSFLEVLNRRREIENYLTNLKIERAKDDSIVSIPDNIVYQKKDSSQKQNADDSVQIAKAKTNFRNLGINKQKQTDSAQSAVQKIKIDNVQVTKIKMNAQQLASLQHQTDSIENALKKLQQSKADSLQASLARAKMDSLKAAVQKLKSDSEQLTRSLPKMQFGFTFDPDKPHNVAILITKVDQVYVTETRNAFNRYDRENYYNKTININNVSLNDTLKLVVISNFENANAALTYMDQAKKAAPREVIPWLPADKYSFFIITDENLATLKTNKNINDYKKFLSSYFPSRF